jgi:hypothetical protein
VSPNPLIGHYPGCACSICWPIEAPAGQPTPSADRERAAFMAGWDARNKAYFPVAEAPQNAYTAWLATQPQEKK